MAIKEINMIPPEILAAGLTIRHLRLWFKVLILVLLIFTAVYLVQYQWLLKLENHQFAKSSSDKEIPLKIAELSQAQEEMDAKLKDLLIKNKMLVAMAEGQVFYEILALLSNAFDESTWIDQLSIHRIEQTNISIITLNGFSLSHNTLGIFLKRLSSVPQINDVVLINAKKNEDTLDKGFVFSGTIGFKLSCSVAKVP